MKEIMRFFKIHDSHDTETSKKGRSNGVVQKKRVVAATLSPRVVSSAKPSSPVIGEASRGVNIDMGATGGVDSKDSDYEKF